MKLTHYERIVTNGSEGEKFIVIWRVLKTREAHVIKLGLDSFEILFQ